MKIELSIKECEELGHVHYLLASGFYTGTAKISIAEQKELFEKACLWFDRAYIYGGSIASQRLAEVCEQKVRELQPRLYAIAS
jgi:hypothetical protein